MGRHHGLCDDARSGYRSGAINPQSVNIAAQTAAPEEVLDYEIGIKSDFALWEMPVRVNLAGLRDRLSQYPGAAVACPM